jgi:hypothetical protein
MASVFFQFALPAAPDLLSPRLPLPASWHTDPKGRKVERSFDKKQKEWPNYETTKHLTLDNLSGKKRFQTMLALPRRHTPHVISRHVKSHL